MPDNLPLAAFVLGAVLLLLGLTHGPVKIFGAEAAGTKGRLARAVSGLLGALLIGASLWIWLVTPGQTSDKGALQAGSPCDGFPELKCVRWEPLPYSAITPRTTHHYVTNQCAHNVIVALCIEGKPEWSCRIEALAPKDKRPFAFAHPVEIEGPLGERKARLLSKAAECQLEFPVLR